MQPRSRKVSPNESDSLPEIRNCTVGFSFLYVFVVFEHGRRRVIHFSTTYHPSMAWVIHR
ncbi:hypothetical protein MYX84_08915, partial [Acidobacteria bacterium AH-259-O06]|nr:hypothetical protein [Acidobacteria bacterium AH-259-O06]